MRIRLLVLIVLALSLLPLYAAAAPRVAESPPFAAAMRPAFANDVDRDDLPRYTLDLAVDPAARRLTGHMSLAFRNTTGTTLRDVALRLYQHFPPDIFGDGGDVRMDISDVVVQGAATQGVYESRRTMLRLPLPVPVAAGESITLSLRYTANIVSWAQRDGTFALPSYYPMLAVWQNGWRADVSNFPDRVFAASALYAATISVPEGYTVVASGSTVSTATRQGRTTFDVVTGPVREFAFSVGRFAVARATHSGIDIHVWHRPGIGLESSAEQVALHAAASLASLESRFGAYPYRELDFHLLSAGRGFDIGAEFPGLIVILLNGRYTDQTRYIVAHEVAHQWFYGLVGNDVFNEPWLDESFAQYSGVLVEEDWGGKAAAQRVYDQQVARLAARTKQPAGLGTAQYGSWNAYYAGVYGRGAQFLHTLRGEIGDESFFAGVREYATTHRYGIATSEDVRAALERSSGRDLGPIFKRWLGR